MKRLTYILVLATLIISACNKKEAISNKVGIKLDPVSNLVLQKLTDTTVKLTWTNPSTVPAEVQQPLKIYIETKEITGVMQSIPVPELTLTLENAPTEYTMTLPDATKKLMFTVKVNGTAVVTDNRYSGNIFSLGQSVQFN